MAAVAAEKSSRKGGLQPPALVIAVIFACMALASSAQSQSDAPPERPPGANSNTKVNPKSGSSESSEFTPQLAEALMDRLAEAMRSHNLTKTRALFDAQHMGAQFMDNLPAAYNYYESFEPFYRILSTAPNADGTGTIVADFSLDATPRQQDLPARRRHANLQVQVALVRTASGASQWRIVALDPANVLFEF